MNQDLLTPTYLPDILSTVVLATSSKVIFEKHDNYQKQTFRNRTRIATANGMLQLTIPVKHTGNPDRHKKTADAIIDNSFLWQRQHWRSLTIAYRTSPFFEFYEDDFKPLFSERYENLFEFNLKGILIIAEALGITLDYEYTKTYAKEPEGISDYRILANPKRKQWIDIPKYSQVFDDKNGFIPHVSVLDLLFNLGPESSSYLQQINLQTLS